MAAYTGMQALDDWARARLAEMNAAIAAMEARPAELHGIVGQQTARTLVELRKWREEFDAGLRAAQDQGEEVWAASRQLLEPASGNFERNLIVRGEPAAKDGDGDRLAGFMRRDLGCIGPEQRIVQTIDTPCGTRSLPTSPGRTHR